MEFIVRIGNLSLEWKRAINRVLFFVSERSLVEEILRKVEKSLLLSSRQFKTPLVTIERDDFLRFLGQKFTVEEFVEYVDEHKPFKGFIMLIKPEAFYRKPVIQSALCLWRRSRPLGIPAFAVCDEDANPLWREFATDAFTRLYLINPGQEPSSELLVQNDHVKSFIVKLGHNMIAVCQKVAVH